MSLMSSDDEDASSDNKPELSPLEVEELLLLSSVKEKRDDDDNDETNNERPISSDNKAEVAPLEIEELLPVDGRDDDNHNNNARPISRRGRTNSFFFLGSLLYVWLAIWDLPDKDIDINIDEMEHVYGMEDVDNMDIDNDDFIYLDISDFFVISFSPDKALAGMAAFCYVLDAGVELRQLRLSPEQSTHHLMHNLRRLPLQLAVGFTFGLAAILEFASTLFDSNGVLFLSNHVYLLNAMLLITGKQQQWSMHSISTTLEVIADVLFVTGSVNDVVLSYWYIIARRKHPTGDEDDSTVAIGDLVSAGLWLIVAILYIVADYCSTNGDDDDHSEGEYEAIDDDDDEMATFEIPPIFSSSNDDASVSSVDDEIIIVEVKDPHSSSSSSSNEDKKSWE